MMKRYIRSEYIRSNMTDMKNIEESEASDLFYNYVDECYKSSGLLGQYPDIELEYATSGSTLRNYAALSSRVLFYVKKKNYSVNKGTRMLMQIGIGYVTKHNKNSETVNVVGITEGSYYINKDFEDYIEPGVSGSHKTQVANNADYMKRNPDIKSTNIEDVLPRNKVISLLKKYIPMCYDAFLSYVEDTPNRESKLEEEKERREREKRNLLDSIDLDEEFEKHRGAKSQYVVGNNIRDRGSSPIIHKYEWEFSADGDYFALIALSLGNMIADSYLDDSTLEYEAGEEFLKDIFYHYPTYTKLLRSPFIKDVKHPDEYTTISYLKNASTGKYLFGKPD